jgi:hypothetical protein
LENNQYINSTDLESFEMVDSVEQILEILGA